MIRNFVYTIKSLAQRIIYETKKKKNFFNKNILPTRVTCCIRAITFEKFDIFDIDIRFIG